MSAVARALDGWGALYRHGNHKVGAALLEPAYLGDEQGSQVGDERLYDEDEGNDGKFSELLGGQLRGKLGKDWTRRGQSRRGGRVRVGQGGSLRQGVKSCVLRLARNFWLSASNWPIRAMMYPGRLTQTTSMTASKTRRVRFAKSGCEL